MKMNEVEEELRKRMVEKERKREREKERISLKDGFLALAWFLFLNGK